MFDPGLGKGEVISNRELMNIFHCACEGGIRYSSKTKTIVIVVNNTREGRPNIWKEDILEFAGRPAREPGSLTGANRRLEQFLASANPVFLFIVDRSGEYRYEGPVISAGKPDWTETATHEPYPVFPVKVSWG